MGESQVELRTTARRAAVAYIATLAVIAALIVTSGLIMRASSSKIAVLTHELAVIGDQRVRALQIYSLLKEVSTGATSPKEARSRLKSLQKSMRDAHLAISVGDPRFGLSGVDNAEIGQLFFYEPHNIERHVNELSLAVDFMVLRGRAPPDLHATAQSAFAIDAGLVEVARIRRAQSELQSSDMAWTQTLVSAALVLALMVAGVGIFRPLNARLRRGAEALVAANRQLEKMLRHDPLTDLPNRKHLGETLKLMLHRAARGSEPVGLVQLDLAGFRQLTDHRGDTVSDASIVHVAGLISDMLRKGDFLARSGPDEFVVITDSVKETADLLSLGRRLRYAIGEPITIEGGVVELDTSIGVHIVEPGDTDVGLALGNLSLSLKKAKAIGAPVAFSEELRQAHEARRTLRRELDEALANGDVTPFFQPQIDVRTGAVIGFEALARWRHPNRGWISPAEFIDAVAEFGFGDRLADAMLNKSLDTLKSWREEGLEAPCVGVNFAAGDLCDSFMVERIRWAVESRSMEPTDLCIEILETVLVDGADTEMASTISALSRSGFRIDLDDFGTGHASIATLQRFPVDRIKIDRSFITDLTDGGARRKVVSAMIDLAHSLNVEALAEGVESEGEREVLRGLGCDHIQGFLISKPMEPDAAARWLRAQAALKRARA